MSDIVERLRNGKTDGSHHTWAVTAIHRESADTIAALTAERDALLATLAEEKAGEEVKPMFGIRFKLSFDDKGRCTTFYKSQAEELFGEWVWLIKATDGMNSPLYASSTPALTYSSTQETECACCGRRKHTPLRRDEMGGYVCLTCIDKKMDSQYRQLAEAVDALEPFARIGGYVTEECGWTPDDEIELMFGDRGYVLATTEARHFIRAREVHRKAKGRNPVEKQNSGDNP